MKITSDDQFLFWQKWLYYSSLIFAIIGIVLALFGNSFLFEPYNTMLANLLWHRSLFPVETIAFRSLMYALLGGTMACCYLLLAFIAKYPFKNKEQWARNAIIIAFSVWVLIDSTACIYFGIYPQVYLINAFSILIKALPLIFTWKHFNKQTTIHATNIL